MLDPLALFLLIMSFKNKISASCMVMSSSFVPARKSEAIDGRMQTGGTSRRVKINSCGFILLIIKYLRLSLSIFLNISNITVGVKICLYFGSKSAKSLFTFSAQLIWSFSSDKYFSPIFVSGMHCFDTLRIPIFLTVPLNSLQWGQVLVFRQIVRISDQSAFLVV